MRRGFCFWVAMWWAGQGCATGAVQAMQLPNGLRVLVKEDHRAPVVLSSIWYQVGGSDEPKGLTGISHVIEHMMFRGTPSYPAGEFDRLMAAAGAQQNAETTNDYTMYYQLLPKAALALSFRLEADRMTNLLLNPQAFSREMQVIMEERRMRFENNPQALAYERYATVAFEHSPYQHQAIGSMQDLQQMTVADARRWYATWYHPNNAIVVVVGDVTAKQVFALAKQNFGKLPSVPLPTRVSPPVTDSLSGPRTVAVRLTAQLPILIQGYRTPTFTTDGNQRHLYALQVLAYLLGGSNSSRLDNQLLRQDKLVTSITASYDPFARYAQQFEIVAIPAANVAIPTITSAITQQIKQLQQQGVTAAELERVKVQLLASNVYRLDSLQAQAAVLGGAAVVGVPWQWAEQFSEGVAQVTAQDVRDVANRYLVPQALTSLVLTPAPPATAKETHEKTP